MDNLDICYTQDVKTIISDENRCTIDVLKYFICTFY